MTGPDSITGLLYGAAIVGIFVGLGCIVAAIDSWIAARQQIADLTTQLDTAERDRLQTEAAYLRLRAEAPVRRGQDTPRTSADPRLRPLDGGKA